MRTQLMSASGRSRERVGTVSYGANPTSSCNPPRTASSETRPGAESALPLPVPHATEQYAAQACWNQRQVLARSLPQARALWTAVNSTTDLLPYQWAQLMACVLEFQPDLILELGRGRGNSTCAFTEAANLLRPSRCQVHSICMSTDWEQLTRPEVARIVPAEWFEPLHIYRGDITLFEYGDLFASARKALVFWDAHGFEVAECVLGLILPFLADLTHIVIMHDISDTRYLSDLSYGETTLWKGNNWDGPRLRIGNIDSAVEQAVAIFDFTTRNHLNLFSADHSLHTTFDLDVPKREALGDQIGREWFSTQAHWRWFTLNERRGPYTFPRFQPPTQTNGS